MALLDYSLNACSCGNVPVLQTWEDERGRTGTFIECTCGIMQAERLSKNHDRTCNYAIKDWNKRAKRKKLKGGFLTCPCGHDQVFLYEEEGKCYIYCDKCFRVTDELNPDGSYKTKQEAIQLWNG